MKQGFIAIILFYSFIGKSQFIIPLDTGLAAYPECLIADTTNNRLMAFGDYSSYCFDTSICPTGLEVWNGMKWEYWYRNIITNNSFKVAQFEGRMICAFYYYDSLNNDRTALVSFSNQFDLDTLALLHGWQPIGDYCIWNNQLVLTGIDSINGILTGGILIYDGINWIPFGIQSAVPAAPGGCAVYNGELYIAGSNLSTSHRWVAKWNGNNWDQVGVGFGGGMCYISDLLTYNGRLYAVGGFFRQDDPTNPGDFISAWDGNQWNDVGGGTNNNVIIANGNIYCAHVFNNKLFVGGSFTSAGGVTTAHIASWNDTVWCGYGTSIYNHVVGEITSLKDSMYISFVVDTLFGHKYKWVGQWNGGSWSDSCGVQWIGMTETEILNSMIVFPNPASNTINISFTNPFHSEITLNVFDIYGKEITSKNLGRSQGDLTYPLDITGFADGVYYVKLRLGEHILMKKFIKQN